MLIDPFQPDCQSELIRRHAALPSGVGLVLLIDGAFIPKLVRQLGNACKPILLFELLPGCSKEARDVSPFLVSFDPGDKLLLRLLTRCSGWPMLSVLTTYESVEHLAKRLVAWCIVDVEGQSFNFRFPDTRRLPMIFETLTRQQRGELTGNAIGWHYIARNGNWSSLPLEASTIPLSVSDRPTLDETQFGKMLRDSEPDEMWVQLLDRGVRTHLLPSQRHTVLSNAIHVADESDLDDLLKIDWCIDCLEKDCHSNSDTLRASLAEWIQQNSRSENEPLYRTD